MTTITTDEPATLPGSHLGYFNDVDTPVWDRVTHDPAVDVPTMALPVVTA